MSHGRLDRANRDGPSLVVSVALLALLGCFPGHDRPRAEHVESSIAELVADGLADLRQAPARLEPEDSTQHSHFSGGWHPPEVSEGEEGSTITTVSSRGSAAVIDVQLTATSDLDITVWGSGRRADGPDERPTASSLPPFAVDARWNDEPITPKIERYGPVWALRVRIQKTSQRLGLNRLTLMPHHWVDLPGAEDALPKKMLGLTVQHVVFDRDAPPSANPTPTSAVEADSGEVLQQPGSVFTTYAMLPDEARLTGRLAGGAAGRGRIVLELDGAPPSVLFDSSDVGLPTNFDLDLSAYAGRAVGLAFVASGVDPLHWIDPSISGLGAEGVSPRSTDPSSRAAGALRPNILIVLFDTMRADATEPYGAPAGRSPAIARLASEGTLFRNAFSNAASTRVSVSSLLTGLYPPRHRVRGLADRIPPEVPYAPRILSEHGYRTIGVVNNPQVAGSLGFADGFDAFEELYRKDAHQLRRDLPDPRARARWTWENFVEPSISKDPDEPFFAYVHELDPHYPYEPLPPFDELGVTAYRGSPLASSGFEHVGVRFDNVLRLLTIVNDGLMRLDPASLSEIRRRYAGEVAYMDAYLGWILDRLETSGLDKTTAVLFVSDHGEEFLEHGRWGHGPQLFDPAVRIPMVLKLPRGRGRARVVETPVELVDVMPTILSLAEIPVPSDVQGRALGAKDADRLLAVDRNRASFAYSDARYLNIGGVPTPASRQASIRVGSYKLIRTRYDVPEGGFFRFELYETADDPEEQIDLWATRPVLGHTLRQRLFAQDLADSRLTPMEHESASELDPEMRNRLRALGYGD